MKTIALQDGFGYERLRSIEAPAPSPGPDQVLIRMAAASINYRDLVSVKGQDRSIRLPYIPLSDGAGEVIAVGAKVTRAKPGDRVMPIFFQRWLAGDLTAEARASRLGSPLPGVLAEQVVVDGEGVVRVPEHLSDEEASTLPCAGLTAWNAITGYGGTKPGDTVLVLGTSSVGLFALQFAKLAGARVILTSSTDEKLARAKALGADQVINYRTTPDWSRTVRALTDGNGADLVIELGGAETLDNSLKAVRPSGRISLIGIVSGATAKLDLISVVTRNVRMHGVTVGHRESFEAMARAIAQHRMRPVIDRVFPMEQAAAAFAHAEDPAHFGKVCIRIGFP